MATSTHFMYNLDPDHRSCVGGRKVVTCKGCAGNAPRETICRSCNGCGLNVSPCPHCHPAAAAAVAAARATAAASAETPGSSGSPAPSSPGSLSRSSSTSNPYVDPRVARAYAKYGDGRGNTSCGRMDSEMNKPRNPNP
ncbi:hypothetical protein CBS147332_6769 [Penicillium roqueforti]|nr:hypothetical protein CBS147332_6769 [Penicillium roqueforti]KAI3112149.1 hypothetical protein CBS147331_4703 [Penicillium roqueforti]